MGLLSPANLAFDMRIGTAGQSNIALKSGPKFAKIVPTTAKASPLAAVETRCKFGRQSSNAQQMLVQGVGRPRGADMRKEFGRIHAHAN